MSLVSAGALSSCVPPPPSLLAAHAEEPALGVLRTEPRDAPRVSFTSMLPGVLPHARTSP
ncbi:hypothetical protein [Streptomyces sp. NPDC005009]